MNKSLGLCAVAVAALSIPASAQRFGDSMRAQITGGGGNEGKCTIEVRVDNVAEVEVRGDTARIRTLAGNPASFRRFVCNSPMPPNSAGIRFQGVDGRGRQNLVSGGGNGPVVVRIEDPQGGEEGYTFDLTWSGNYSGNSPGGGYGGGGGYGNGNYGNRGNWGGGGFNQAVQVCQDEVRNQARSRYGIRDLQFTGARADDNSGRNDWIIGTFQPRGGFNNNYRGEYRFECSVNLNNGRVRNVNVGPANNWNGGGNWGNNPNYNGGGNGNWGRNGYWGNYNQDRAVSDCESAVMSRLTQEGFGNARIRDTRVDNGRDRYITGYATGQQRGYGRVDFTFGCAVDPNRGQVMNVDLNRQTR